MAGAPRWLKTTTRWQCHGLPWHLLSNSSVAGISVLRNITPHWNFWWPLLFPFWEKLTSKIILKLYLIDDLLLAQHYWKLEHYIFLKCDLQYFLQRLHLVGINLFNGWNPNHITKITASFYSKGSSLTSNMKQIYESNFCLRIMYLRHNCNFKVALGHY